MTLYEGEVLEWNWIRSYGIATITKIIGGEPGIKNHMVGKEIFLSQSFKSDKTKQALNNLTDHQRKEHNVEFISEQYPKIWFNIGETIQFSITTQGLATDINKVELD